MVVGYIKRVNDRPESQSPLVTTRGLDGSYDENRLTLSALPVANRTKIVYLGAALYPTSHEQDMP